MASITERYARMSGRERFVVWLIVAGVALLFWIEVDSQAQAFSERADTAERKLNDYESRVRARARGGGGLARGLERHGQIEWVGDPDERAVEMLAVFTEVVATHRVPDGWRITSKSSSLRGAEADPVFSNRRVDRLIYTFSFEATPERLTAVVRDLEASPLVLSLNNLSARVVDEAAKSLAVQVEVETWVWRNGRGARR